MSDQDTTQQLPAPEPPPEPPRQARSGCCARSDDRMIAGVCRRPRLATSASTR